MMIHNYANVYQRICFEERTHQEPFFVFEENMGSKRIATHRFFFSEEAKVGVRSAQFFTFLFVWPSANLSNLRNRMHYTSLSASIALPWQMTLFGLHPSKKEVKTPKKDQQKQHKTKERLHTYIYVQ